MKTNVKTLGLMIMLGCISTGVFAANPVNEFHKQNLLEMHITITSMPEQELEEIYTFSIKAVVEDYRKAAKPATAFDIKPFIRPEKEIEEDLGFDTRAIFLEALQAEIMAK